MNNTPTGLTQANLTKTFAYHLWAWTRLWESLAALPADAFLQPIPSSFPSLRDTLVHCYGADGAWLARIQQDTQRWPDPDEFPDWASLRAAWSQTLERWPAALEGRDAHETINYKSLRGEAFRNTLGEIVHHVVNHGSYHRGQVVTMIRQLGGQAAQTDMIVWSRQQ